MVPDFALRLQSMIRSMQEVVLPAIPKQQQLASDQAKIILGNLRIMAEQQAHVFQYLLVELSEYSALVRTLIEVADGGDATHEAVERARAVLARAAPIAELPIPSQIEIATLAKSLKQAADDLVRAADEDGASAFRRETIMQVMQQSEHQIARERTWFRGAGFELEPEKLTPLDEVLASAKSC